MKYLSSISSDNCDVTFVNGTFTGDLTVDTNTLYVDSTNNRVGIGTTSPYSNVTFQYTGNNSAGTYYGIFQADTLGENDVLITAVDDDCQSPSDSTYSDSFTVISNGKTVFTGDTNNDGKVDLADAVRILSFLFSGKEELPCMKSGDVNDDGKLDLADAITVLSFLFSSGELTVPNGDKIRTDDLGCSTYPDAEVNDVGCEIQCK